MRNQVRSGLLIIVAALVSFSMQSCQRKVSTPESQTPASANRSKADSSSPAAANNQNRIERDGMILINSGKFLMGTEDGMSYEAPVHEVTVKSFWMDRHEVTVAEFSMFISATGYKTDAEKFGWSGAFNLKTGEWKKTKDANWRHPDGASWLP